MFYRENNGEIEEAPIIISPQYDLVEEMKDQYSYPIDGWYWFDSIYDAHVFFEIQKTE